VLRAAAFFQRTQIACLLAESTITSVSPESREAYHYVAGFFTKHLQ
jgi:hypothetical protein